MRGQLIFKLEIVLFTAHLIHAHLTPILFTPIYAHLITPIYAHLTPIYAHLIHVHYGPLTVFFPQITWPGQTEI